MPFLKTSLVLFAGDISIFKIFNYSFINVYNIINSKFSFELKDQSRY